MHIAVYIGLVLLTAACTSRPVTSEEKAVGLALISKAHDPEYGLEMARRAQAAFPEASAEVRAAQQLGGEVKIPELVHSVKPKYPFGQRLKGGQGLVFVALVVETDGSVSEVRDLTGVAPVFAQAAIEAVKEFKFRPGTVGGKPVRFVNVLPVVFQLQ